MRLPDVWGEAADLGAARDVLREAPKVDVADPRSVHEGALDTERHLGSKLDLLVNNAGIGFTASRREAAEGQLSQLRAEALLGVFQVNAVGPALVTQALVPLLCRAEAGGKVINITSDLGSISGSIS